MPQNDPNDAPDTRQPEYQVLSISRGGKLTISALGNNATLTVFAKPGDERPVAFIDMDTHTLMQLAVDASSALAQILLSSQIVKH